MAKYNIFDYAAIGNRIRDNRKRLKLSQEKLLEVLEDKPHFGRNTLSDLENGKPEAFAAVNLAQLSALCELFGCSIGYLLGEYDNKSADSQLVHDFTGLSEPAIDYLHEKSCSPKYLEVLDILLAPGNFDNALFHISEYMKATYLYEGLTQIRQERKNQMLLKSIQEYGDLRSYNYSHNDSLDAQIKRTEEQKDIEELRINDCFRFIIQQIESIAKKTSDKAPTTN